MRYLLAGLLLSSTVFAQSALQESRASQQELYRTWRQTEPNLERDASSAGATLGARADKASAEATKYFVARRAFLESAAADANQRSAIEAVTIAPDSPGNLDLFLNTQNTILGSSISAIAADPDRGIQQLRQALERERAAIAAIGAALTESQSRQEAVVQASNGAEQKRTLAAQEFQRLAASLQQSAQLTDQSGTAWTNYYRSLSDAARGVAAPVTSSAPPPSSPPKGMPNPAEAPVAVSNPPPASPVRATPPVPLSRYLGDWTYPTVGAHYHGAQPESVELVVREENGQASGTLSARFRLPPGIAADPLVKFNFQGAFESSRIQRFVVAASSGAAGIIELIPGPAFNLVEVNFSIDEKPGTIRQANFLLVKK